MASWGIRQIAFDWTTDEEGDYFIDNDQRDEELNELLNNGWEPYNTTECYSRDGMYLLRRTYFLKKAFH